MVSRRLWLVLLVFGVTTASAIWALSRQRIYYQSHLSLQVNDPVQPARGLVAPSRFSGIDIFVDPMESEIQVLRSSPIAAAVVDSLGLRLRPVSEDRVRSDLFRDVSVEQGAPEDRLELVYDAAGRSAQLRAPDGTVLATAETGTRIEAPFLSFHLEPPPEEARLYALDLLPTSAVVAEITGNLSATQREDTNLIDAYFLSSDPVIVPRVLNAVAAELRRRGAERVARRATADIEFVEQRLDSARDQLDRTAADIRSFKQSAAYSNLSAQEQQLVTRIQNLDQEMRELDERRSALTQAEGELRARGPSQADLAAVAAQLSEGSNPQIRRLVDQITEKRAELRALLTEEQLASGHPRVRFVEGEINSLGISCWRRSRPASRCSGPRSWSSAPRESGSEVRVGSFPIWRINYRRWRSSAPSISRRSRSCSPSSIKRRSPGPRSGPTWR